MAPLTQPLTLFCRKTIIPILQGRVRVSVRVRVRVSVRVRVKGKG